MNERETSSPAGSLPPGTELNGIYCVDSLLAAGGMGEIYKGHAIQTGDRVAIKVIRGEMAGNENVVALFRREAAALHSLHHEAIVRYFVFSIDPILKKPYLAMEFVEGGPLGKLIAKGALPVADVLALRARLASGLQAAHERGIVHRDISPDNVLVPGDDLARARIIDFGIARSTHADATTIIGSSFAGKFRYASPEQLGMFGGDVGAKSDIYSLGLLLVQALRGSPVDMGANEFEAIERRRSAPDLSDIDPKIRPLLTKMLQPDPASRPSSMAEVAAWTQPDADRTMVLSRNAALTAAPQAPRRRSGLAWATAGLVAVAGLATGGWFAWDHWSVRQEEIFSHARRFILDYRGGDCFFALPARGEPGRFMVDGFGARTDSFDAFNRAFRTANGFTAEVAAFTVHEPQCPAISFLSRILPLRRGGGGPALDAEKQAADDPRRIALNGSVSSRLQHVELLAIDDAGLVHNMTDRIRGRTGKRNFSFSLLLDHRDPYPLLLIAAATQAPLAAFQAMPAAADPQVFANALTEIARSDAPVTASVLMIGASDLRPH